MKYMLYLLFFGIISCHQPERSTSGINNDHVLQVNQTDQDTLKKIVKSEDQWKEELNDMEFYVLRKAGTERAFTGDLLKNKENGIYICRGCGLELFSSDSKFESGTGWPSFFKPFKEGHVREDVDYKIGYARTEILCARCDGHLGHVFDDGPKPTGLRYCVNSVSLDFKPKEKK